MIFDYCHIAGLRVDPASMPIGRRKEETKMEQYFTFDRLALITSLMRRYAIDAAQAAELANDILG